MKKEISKPTATSRIHNKVFELLEKHHDGMRWTDLAAEIKASDPTLHPKTVNGTIWLLAYKHPDKVYKPSKGVFRLTKYKK